MADPINLDPGVFNEGSEENTRAARDAERQTEAIDKRTQKIEQRNIERKFGKPLVNVTINGPHTANVRGNQVALHIDGTNNQAPTDEPVPLTDVYIIINGARYLTDIYTTGRLDAA